MLRFMRLWLASFWVWSNFCNALNIPIPQSINDPTTEPIPAISNLTDGSTAHCTTEKTWISPSVSQLDFYRYSCLDALEMADKDLRLLGRYQLDTEYEFLDRGATPQTTKPQTKLPEKYTTCNENSMVLKLMTARANFKQPDRDGSIFLPAPSP